MGRRPRPTKLKKLRGFSHDKRDYNSVEPEPLEGEPDKPQQIQADPIASKEWDAVCEQLDGMGLLAKSDKTIITLYCVAWSCWLSACERCKKEGEYIQSKANGWLIAPWSTLRTTSAKQIEGYLARLGLTPADRARMRVIKQETQVPDKWKGMIVA